MRPNYRKIPGQPLWLFGRKQEEMFFFYPYLLGNRPIPLVEGSSVLSILYCNHNFFKSMSRLNYGKLARFLSDYCVFAG
jgi:hypothetical protein